jgi:hypothetical protein|tara:strand:+ start:1592 stop:1825 length:234 start_codon:yes stop_codon:yes gene_type:complete
MIDLNLCDPQHVQALLRLKETGETALLGLFEAEAELAKARLVSATDTVTIHRLQGRAEAFQDLLTSVEEAMKVVNRP